MFQLLLPVLWGDLVGLLAQSFRIRLDCCGLLVLLLAIFGAWKLFSGKNRGDQG